MGVSVEREDSSFRIDHLRRTPAQKRFLLLEPLLGPLYSLDLTGIDWVIVGGESGHGARPMEEAWVLDIMAQCRRTGVPFFFKQWGGRNKKQAGRLLNRRTWDSMPARRHDLQGASIDESGEPPRGPLRVARNDRASVGER